MSTFVKVLIFVFFLALVIQSCENRPEPTPPEVLAEQKAEREAVRSRLEAAEAERAAAWKIKVEKQKDIDEGFIDWMLQNTVVSRAELTGATMWLRLTPEGYATKDLEAVAYQLGRAYIARSKLEGGSRTGIIVRVMHPYKDETKVRVAVP